MMKIRNCLLVSISYFSLCSLAQANISEGEKEFIFTHTSKGVEQTSAASFGVIKYRGMNTAAVLEHTHLLHLDSHSQLLSSPNLPQTQSEHRASFAPISLALTDGPTASVASLEIREQDTGNRALTAAVCFVTDTGECRGNEFDSSPDDGGWENPFPPNETCQNLGYNLTSCPPGKSPRDFCPLSDTYFKDCECTETCPQGYQNTTCGSGLKQTSVLNLNCQTCYRCSACDDECPSGYSLETGTCNESSTLTTECGSPCYKIKSNSCSNGQLSAPTESGGYKNKIVAYTECGNPCFQSYNDNCPSGYVKTKEKGKCYASTIKYTDYGSACYKEKPCCDNSCSGYRSIPDSSICPMGYNSGTTGCGNACYTCKDCVDICKQSNLLPYSSDIPGEMVRVPVPAPSPIGVQLCPCIRPDCIQVCRNNKLDFVANGNMSCSRRYIKVAEDFDDTCTCYKCEPKPSSSSGGDLCTRICSERGLICDNVARSICAEQGLYVVQLGYFGDINPICPCSRCGTWEEHNGH